MTLTDRAPDDPRIAEGDARAPRPLGARLAAGSLPLHLALLALVLAAIVALTTSSGTFVADDGSYQLQLRALGAGSWEHASGTEALDPDGSHFPIANAEATEGGWAPSAKHPAWPWLAHAIAPVTGTTLAFPILGALGVLALAAAAWLLAAERDERTSPWAFWIAGTAPVALTAAVPWAHALAAGTAAWAVLGVAWLLRGHRRALAVALVAAGVASTAMLRTEGLLFAVALGIGVVVAGRQAGRSVRWTALAGAAVLAVAFATVKVESLWIHSITGGQTSTFEPRSGGGIQAGLVEGRLQGALRSMLDAARPTTSVLLGVAVAAMVVTAAMAVARRGRWFTYWVVSAVAALLFLGLRVLAFPNLPVSGLLANWPVAVSGVAAAAAVAWRRARLEVVVVAPYAAAIFATQYADGGAWGGRFFALATAPIAVVAAMGLGRLRAAAPETAAGSPSTPARLLVALLVVPAALGVLVVREVQQTTASRYDFVASRVEGVAVTPAAELPRMMWDDDLAWLVVDDDDPDDLTGLLGSLGDEGPTTVSLVLLDADLELGDEAIADQRSWREVDRERRDALTVVVLRRDG